MRFLGNILTNRKFEDCEFYNVVDKKEDLIINIPTLVIGWEFTKTLYPNANIISWEIENDIYWTFNNRERRQSYEEIIVKFKKLVVNRFIKSTEECQRGEIIGVVDMVRRASGKVIDCTTPRWRRIERLWLSLPRWVRGKMLGAMRRWLDYKRKKR